MPNAQLVTIIFHTKIPAARKSLILVAREGIERPAYLAEFKDIFENAYKVTLKMIPSKAWLLADVHGG